MRRTPKVAGTKFVAPPLPRAHVADPALLGRVVSSVRGSTATLIRAPGGAGKTALARAAVDALDLPWAWITFDEWDDRQRVLELLQGASAGIGIELPGLRQMAGGTTSPLAVRDAASVVVNDLLDAAVDNVVLVLDDAHALMKQVDALTFLGDLVAMAPPSLHLLITTRRPLPLRVARLEASGRLVAIEPDALRVDAEQAAGILEAMDLAADEEAVTHVLERTGGWVTGIRLMASHPDRGRQGTVDVVGRYVEEELLADLPNDDARALVDLAVLRRIRPADVTALTGRHDGARWLDAMVDQIPVLISKLDEHTAQLHELLREALVGVLASDPERLRQLHVAAAEAVDDWQEQLHHLLSAGAFAQAADVLESHSRAVFPRVATLAQVRGWMDQLPRAVWEERPWLRVVEGVTAAHLAEHTAARSILRAVEPDLCDDVLATWAVERYLQRAGDDPLRRTERLRALEGDAGFTALRPAIRAEHELGMAHGAVLSGRWEEAACRHDAAIAAAVASGDVVSAEVVSQNTSPFLAMADGGVDRIDGYVDWLDRRLGEASPLLAAAQHVHRALVAFLRGEPATADVHAAAAVDLTDRLRLPYLRAQVDWVLVCGMTVRGDLAPAVERLESRRRSNDPASVPADVAVGCTVQLARLRRSLGHHDALRALVRSSHEAKGVVGPQAALVQAAVAVPHAHLAVVEGRAEEAVDILTAAILELGAARVVPGVGRLQLDLVVALADAGRRDDALQLLLEELALLERLDAIGLVAATGSDLLPVLDRAIETGSQAGAARVARAVLAPDARPAAVALGDGGTLSSREVEVLRLLSVGLSNAQIAEELVLSVNTVKTHVRNVLRKLDVPTRAAAAGAARSQGIVAGRSAPPGTGS